MLKLLGEKHRMGGPGIRTQLGGSLELGMEEWGPRGLSAESLPGDASRAPPVFFIWQALSYSQAPVSGCALQCHHRSVWLSSLNALAPL